jgi:hypothetical protein
MTASPTVAAVTNVIVFLRGLELARTPPMYVPRLSHVKITVDPPAAKTALTGATRGHHVPSKL